MALARHCQGREEWKCGVWQKAFQGHTMGRVKMGYGDSSAIKIFKMLIVQVWRPEFRSSAPCLVRVVHYSSSLGRWTRDSRSTLACKSSQIIGTLWVWLRDPALENRKEEQSRKILISVSGLNMHIHTCSCVPADMQIHTHEHHIHNQ